MGKKLTTEEFIERARAVHGDKYDYSKVKYVNNSTNVQIYCKKHGTYFQQQPNNHMQGKGCSLCGRESMVKVQKYDTETFVIKAKNVHGNKYDYSMTEYQGATVKVQIRCAEHNHIFKQNPVSHLMGCGCPLCGREKSRQGSIKYKDTKEFIVEAEKVHGNDYDYSLVKYKGTEAPVKIRCKKHKHWFIQPARNHLNGARCPKCVGEEISARQCFTLEEFVEKARDVHGNTYNYSLVKYKTGRIPIKIICRKHGIFEQTPAAHLVGKGCSKCAKEYLSSLFRKPLEQFVAEAVSIHGDAYDYSLVNYVNCKTEVTLVCSIHGEFTQTPEVHLMGCGCPICNSSKGEKLIASVLDDMGVVYTAQYRFDNCRYQRTLPFDFYLPEHNQIIEYHGIQHYKEFDFFGGHYGFIVTRLRDAIKKNYCRHKNIKFIEIPYWDFDKIEQILNKTIRR